ncbi:MAG: dTMP kinase, partial [Candidatus Gallimonas sp.]
MNRGKFIVFEGIDGSGKSTQLKLLAKYLEGKGVSCYATCEPTDSPFGGMLRSCLTGRLDADERAIAALFAADRLDHIFNPLNGLEGKLAAGITVLCDRYYLSSFAYNGGIVPLEWVIELNRPAMEALRPDLVVYIDVPAERSMERVARRGETERYETLDRQKKIREAYFRLFRRFETQEHIEIVKSESDKSDTQGKIRRIADELF